MTTAALTSFWSWQLVGALILNAIVQAVTIGAFAARIAGVVTRRIAISISLFSLFVTASRLANLVYTPLLGGISDVARNVVAHAEFLKTPAIAEPALAQYEWQLRAIVFAGTLGTMIGGILLPTFMYLFVRGIGSFERLDSLPKALLRMFDPAVLRDVFRSLRAPNPASWGRFKLAHVPPKLLIANTVLQSMYAIGVVAAVYAAVRDPLHATTATLLSGIVNGIGTIAFTLFVDPTSAQIVDQATHGKRSLDDVKSMVFYLTATTIVGTLISQLFLYPAALVIGAVARLVNHGWGS